MQAKKSFRKLDRFDAYVKMIPMVNTVISAADRAALIGNRNVERL
ncbi:hypothetical protein BH11CYA1_BH11CYA1_33450 [soil metagenome]